MRERESEGARECERESLSGEYKMPFYVCKMLLKLFIRHVLDVSGKSILKQMQYRIAVNFGTLMSIY